MGEREVMNPPPIDQDPDQEEWERWGDERLKGQLTTLAQAGWLPSQDIVRSVGAYALKRIKALEDENDELEQIVSQQDKRISELARTIERLIAERDGYDSQDTPR